MKRNMKQWMQEVLDAPVKRAMPVLSIPAIQLMDITVRDLISSSDLQSKGMKLVADRDTGRLIGAQLMCQHASDIISQLSAALVNGLTVCQLLAVMRPHPSFEEAMTEALERLAEKL